MQYYMVCLLYTLILDLSAAFDTVDHTILLRRLETSFGVTGDALKWIASYLSAQSQHVMINGVVALAATDKKVQ